MTIVMVTKKFLYRTFFERCLHLRLVNHAERGHCHLSFGNDVFNSLFSQLPRNY